MNKHLRLCLFAFAVLLCGIPGLATLSWADDDEFSTSFSNHIDELGSWDNDQPLEPEKSAINHLRQAQNSPKNPKDHKKRTRRRSSEELSATGL